jgi:hypothetical protein
MSRPHKAFAQIAIFMLCTIAIGTIEAKKGINGFTTKDFLKQFGKEFLQAMQRNQLVKMNKYYANHCSHLSEDHLKYDYKRLKQEDEKLAGFLNFTRNHPDSIPLEKINSENVLSIWGKILFIVPIFFMGASLVSFILTVMFFYFPDVNNRLFRFVLSQDYEIEVVDIESEKLPLEQRDYYKAAKNVISRQKSLFRLFVSKFCLSIGMLLCLLFGLGLVINFDTTADCGITKAAINIFEGKEGNYFTEFGLLSNKSLLHKFRQDLENFEHHKDIDYNKLIELNPEHKAMLL